jgi:hypothetical protein
MNKQLMRAIAMPVIVLTIAGCGGSDGGNAAPPAPAPAPAPAPTGIGPAGGTVTGSNGATVAVPAGALSQTVNIQVTEISPASVSLPMGVDRVGAVYALTPHDTSFAVPVAVNIPFDPAQVPAGSSARLMKTSDSARTVWAEVAGATTSGGTATAQLTSFSNIFVASLATIAAPGTWANVGPPVVTGGPVRLGGLAVSATGRIAVAYVAGSSGTAGLVGELRVSEWDSTSATWSQVGPALNLTSADGPSLASRSIAYDAMNRIVVAWLDRLTLTLVVQRWNNTTAAWDRLGNPLFPVAAATTDPQITIDPVSNRPIVVVTSGPNVTVREWDGAGWTPSGNFNPTSLSGAILTVSNSGQRLLGITYGDDVGGTQLLTRLYAPNAMGAYVTEVGGPVTVTPIPARDFYLDLATDGTSPYALTGDHVAGPMLVRRWSGSAWESIGGDPGLRNFSGLAQLRVTPFGLPLIAFRQGATSPRRVDGLWWDGNVWNTVASPNATTVDVIQFALGLAPNGLPHIALTQRAPTASSQLANELVVRRLVPTTLTVVVSGPAASGSVSSNRLNCPVASSCDVPLPAGTIVALDAVPAAGFSLQSWAGCDAVVALRCTVTVDRSKSVTATFQ